MRKNPVHARVRHEPSEDVIRDYAEHLYEQSGRIAGRDLDNWLEAKACLAANISQHRVHTRRQPHLPDLAVSEACEPPVESRNLMS